MNDPKFGQRKKIVGFEILVNSLECFYSKPQRMAKAVERKERYTWREIPFLLSVVVALAVDKWVSFKSGCGHTGRLSVKSAGSGSYSDAGVVLATVLVLSFLATVQPFLTSAGVAAWFSPW